MPSRTKLYNRPIIKALIALIALLFYCEYAVYYVVLFQCGWPELDPDKIDGEIPMVGGADVVPVKAIFLSDPHLLGPRNGHWFDKLKREWQMYRAFQTAITIHRPEAVFILGDIFDEGQWSGAAEFDRYVARFHSIFSVPKKTRLYVVAGNHDMGFHYKIVPYLNQRFVDSMKSPNARRISLRGNHFVLLNSMALEGDGCFLCRPTEIAINKISKQLKCSKGIGSNCESVKTEAQYSRPILLQHYPMYRESDEMCNEPDEAPEKIKKEKFQERRECLSREASDQLLDVLSPRLIIDGHTHHGCRTKHRDDVLEFTIPSFSWRNKNNPSFLLGVFTPDNYAVSKCHMPVETTLTKIYVLGVICVVIYLALVASRRFNRNRLLKVHL